MNQPFQGLSSIVNVIQRVGPGEISDPNDVKVVQALIRLHTSLFAKRVRVPQVSGNFDAATDSYIYDTRHFLKSKGGNNGVIVDGVVSPTQGSVYSAGAPWTIALLNFQA